MSESKKIYNPEITEELKKEIYESMKKKNIRLNNQKIVKQIKDQTNSLKAIINSQ